MHHPLHKLTYPPIYLIIHTYLLYTQYTQVLYRLRLPQQPVRQRQQRQNRAFGCPGTARSFCPNEGPHRDSALGQICPRVGKNIRSESAGIGWGGRLQTEVVGCAHGELPQCAARPRHSGTCVNVSATFVWCTYYASVMTHVTELHALLPALTQLLTQPNLTHLRLS